MSIPIIVGPGWLVEDLSALSDFTVTPDIVYDVGDAVPATPLPAIDHLSRLFGVDIRLRKDFLILGASGDLQRTRGLEALKAALARAIVTRPGEIFWRPDFGIGLVEFLNLPPSGANVYEMKNRIALSLGGDPAVEELVQNDVVVSREGGLISIYERVKIAGQIEPIELALRSEG